jgi:hypothetical protein
MCTHYERESLINCVATLGTHTWTDAKQIAPIGTFNSSATMWYVCGAGLIDGRDRH